MRWFITEAWHAMHSHDSRKRKLSDTARPGPASYPKPFCTDRHRAPYPPPRSNFPSTYGDACTSCASTEEGRGGGGHQQGQSGTVEGGFRGTTVQCRVASESDSLLNGEETSMSVWNAGWLSSVGFMFDAMHVAHVPQEKELALPSGGPRFDPRSGHVSLMV